jgi:hypothetical protein
MRPLTEELKDLDSPVRQFLDWRFTGGLPEVQRRYRADAPALVVPGAPQEAADQGTVGVAADWLMRFVLHPRPTLRFAAELRRLLPARWADDSDTTGELLHLPCSFVRIASIKLHFSLRKLLSC